MRELELKQQILLGLLIPFFGTAAGSACVFFMRKDLSRMIQRALTGFAAGAMIYVAVEELIPEMSEGTHSNIGVLAFSAGFTVMMILDVALG